MTKEKLVLALIHNGNLNLDEAIVASSDASIAIALQLDISQALYLKFPKPFKTSKDLKALEKEFDKKGMAVYLHEETERACSCGCETEEIKIPLMLAVFGGEDEIRRLLE